MLRETQFLVGGGLTIVAGLLLGAGLFLTGAGVEFFGAWLGAGIAVGFGAFFVYVGRDERKVREEFLSDPVGAEPPTPPARPPAS